MFKEGDPLSQESRFSPVETHYSPQERSRLRREKKLNNAHNRIKYKIIGHETLIAVRNLQRKIDPRLESGEELTRDIQEHFSEIIEELKKALGPNWPYGDSTEVRILPHPLSFQDPISGQEYMEYKRLEAIPSDYIRLDTNDPTEGTEYDTLRIECETRHLRDDTLVICNIPSSIGCVSQEVRVDLVNRALAIPAETSSQKQQQQELRTLTEGPSSVSDLFESIVRRDYKGLTPEEFARIVEIKMNREIDRILVEIIDQSNLIKSELQSYFSPEFWKPIGNHLVIFRKMPNGSLFRAESGPQVFHRAYRVNSDQMYHQGVRKGMLSLTRLDHPNEEYLRLMAEFIAAGGEMKFFVLGSSEKDRPEKKVRAPSLKLAFMGS